MKHLAIYPECPPAYREHPGRLLSPGELYAANREYLARAEETTCYYDHAKLRGNVARCWFFAQAALLLERQRIAFEQEQFRLHTLQAKIAA